MAAGALGHGKAPSENEQDLTQLVQLATTVVGQKHPCGPIFYRKFHIFHCLYALYYDGQLCDTLEGYPL